MLQHRRPVPTDSGGISRERFKQGSRKFINLSGTIGPTKMLNMMSFVASGRLQNAIKNYAKVRKMGAAGRNSNNSAIV